jgi:hypothetical protein
VFVEKVEGWYVFALLCTVLFFKEGERMGTVSLLEGISPKKISQADG